MQYPDITLAKGAIHRPDEPRHFMNVRALHRLIKIRLDGQLVAETSKALRLQEVGHQVYDPVIYLLRADILVDLSRTTRKSHCPLKGDCSWFSLDHPNGTDAAWSYEDTFHFAEAIRGYVAFDPERVSIEEQPL